MVAGAADRPALAARLDALLARDPQAHREMARGDFTQRAGARPIVLMGAGGLGRRTLAGLRAVGIEPVAFADNAPARQGTTLDGVKVLSPADAARAHGSSAAFVVTIWGAGSPHRYAHSEAQLRALGCDVIVPFTSLYWAHSAALLPHYLQDEPHKVLEQASAVRAAFDVWDDDASRAEYLSQVRFRLDGDFGGLGPPVSHPQYLPDDLFRWGDDEWIVDGGAYDGDTLRALVAHRGARAGHVLAAEPDPVNFARLRETIGALPSPLRDRVDARQVALASAPGIMRVESTGTAASTTGAPQARPASAVRAAAGADVVEVPADTIDRLVGDARPTFIKLDIEGAEPDALAGAERTIRRHAPVLAVCVYHRQDHLWRIPLTLRSWRDDYALFLRPHNEEGWDLVCYAVPRARLGRARGAD